MKKPYWILIGITTMFICILIGIFVGRRTAGAYIPMDGAEESIAETQNDSTGKLDINTATLEQLQLIDGIGPSLAQRIIDYRTENGDFKAIEELMNVSGIGEKKFEVMKPYITVGKD